MYKSDSDTLSVLDFKPRYTSNMDYALNSEKLIFLKHIMEYIFFFSSLWLNIVTLSTLGIFVGMALMPTYQSILDVAL